MNLISGQEFPFQLSDKVYKNRFWTFPISLNKSQEGSEVFWTLWLSRNIISVEVTMQHLIGILLVIYNVLLF